MTEERKCPPLGTGSVDFGALHEADARGDDLVEAIEAATTRVEPPAPLTGKETLADLQSLAAAEGVQVEADWHKDDYRTAIAAKRNPAPPQPLSAASDPASSEVGDAGDAA